MPRPSRTGAQRRPIVTAAGPTSVWEAPRPRMRLSSPPKHKGSTSSGPTNCAELTTRASIASLPGLRSTHATSRPLNSRTRTAARRRGRASAPSCGGRRFRGELAVIPCMPYCLGSRTIVDLSMLSAASESLSGGVLIARPSRRCKELNSHESPTHHRWVKGLVRLSIAHTRTCRCRVRGRSPKIGTGKPPTPDSELV
jgi:hypothetical protein